MVKWLKGVVSHEAKWCIHDMPKACLEYLTAYKMVIKGLSHNTSDKVENTHISIIIISEIIRFHFHPYTRKIVPTVTVKWSSLFAQEFISRLINGKTIKK